MATALWGKDWCMPTNEQFEELKSNCDYSFVYADDVIVGFKFISKNNGNSIILPFTGYKEGGSVNSSSYGHYWASTPNNSDEAYHFAFWTRNERFSIYVLAWPRYQGCPVRPVRAPKTAAPKAINLGLPSGTKWASFNVGASKPEDYGGYFAWGETEEKWDYSRDNYRYYQDGKYVNFGNNISGTRYDVAHVKWGGNWCMPTWDDLDELLENTSSEWMSLNGVTGRKFTSKINGNSIFLPAAGGTFAEQLSMGSAYYYANAGISHVRFAGKYWLASRYASGEYPNYIPDDAIYEDDAFYLYLRKENTYINPLGLDDGYTHAKCQYDLLFFAKSVRPVYKE